MVALTIILLITVIALPMIRPAFSHRQLGEGARILQSALAGAHDSAIRNNAPSGLRFLPDPAFPVRRLPDGTIDPSQPLALNRFVPIETAPAYSEGQYNQWVGPLPTVIANLPYPGPATPANKNPTYGQTSVLMVFESPGEWIPLPNGAWFFAANSPTSWFWNVRVGDKLNTSGGKPYWIVGPMNVTPAAGNADLAVNAGAAGTTPPWAWQTTSPDGSQTLTFFPEFLLLVDGRDDNKDGYVDNGWDGVDNDLDGLVDNAEEWIEVEAW